MEKDRAIKEMAELLLSKATMLQYHCPECKSPLFEKNGEIICIVCNKFEKKEKDKKKGSSPETAKIIEKKRGALLKQLEEEKDPKKIAEIAEALDKLGKLA